MVPPSSTSLPAMIAFIKWHRPADAVATEAYEVSLRSFHRKLALCKPPGFEYAVTFRCNPAPWFAAAEVIYSDWYLMRHAAALDKLQDAAVSGACEQPHATLVAQAAPDVATGLYRHRLGRCDLRYAAYAYWFTKPTTINYTELLDTLRPLAHHQKVDLWIRYLGLSPAPECCLLVAEQSSIRAALQQVETTLSQVSTAFIESPLRTWTTSWPT